MRLLVLGLVGAGFAAPALADSEVHPGAQCVMDGLDPTYSPAYNTAAENPFASPKWFSCGLPRRDSGAAVAFDSALVRVHDRNANGHVGCVFIATEPATGVTYYTNVSTTSTAQTGTNLALAFGPLLTAPAALHYLSCQVAATSAAPALARSGVASYQVELP